MYSQCETASDTIFTQLINKWMIYQNKDEAIIQINFFEDLKLEFKNTEREEITIKTVGHCHSKLIFQ